MDSDVPNKIITLEGIRTMFDSIHENVGWDLNEPMEWSYYFSHAEPEALETLAEELEAMGYEVLDLFQDDVDEEDEADVLEPDLWYLQVGMAEVHTPETLDQRNGELYRLAAAHSVGYDGMEVGPLGGDDEGE